MEAGGAEDDTLGPSTTHVVAGSDMRMEDAWARLKAVGVAHGSGDYQHLHFVSPRYLSACIGQVGTDLCSGSGCDIVGGYLCAGATM